MPAAKHPIARAVASPPIEGQLHEVAESVSPPGPIADHVFVALTIPLVARIASAPDWLDVAETAAQRVLSLPRVAPVLATYARTGSAPIAVHKGDAAATEGLYTSLVAQRGTASLFLPLTSDRLLGLLAWACGRLDAGFAHFADGLEFCGRGGYRPEYAWTAFDWADALLRRGRRGDDAKAGPLLDTALEIADSLGMRALLTRAPGLTR